MPASIFKYFLYALTFLAWSGFSPSTIYSAAKPLAMSLSPVNVAEQSSPFARSLQLNQSISRVSPRSLDLAPTVEADHLHARARTEEMRQYAEDSAAIVDGFDGLVSEYRSGGDRASIRRRGNALALDYLALNYKIRKSLTPGKGQQFYDESVPFEPALKDIFNNLKYGMSGLTEMVYEDVPFGALIAPVLYELKCIIDDVLNITKNLLDLSLGAVFKNNLGFCRDAILGLCTLGYLGLGGCSSLLGISGIL